MTATRRAAVPEAAPLPLASRPVVVVARTRPAALALRFGLAGVAVASGLVGWVLFGDTDPDLWTNGYWPVRELMSAAIAFSIGGAALLGYRKARWPAWTLLICGLLAGLALLFAGLWWDTILKYGGFIEVRRVRRAAVDRKRYCDGPTSWVVADGAASALSRRAAARKALEGPARRLSRTGRDCDADERVQLPKHLQSGRVVLLVDPNQSRLADRSRVADRPLAPGHCAATAPDCRVYHRDGGHDRRVLRLHRVRAVLLPAAHCDRHTLAGGRGGLDRGRGAAIPPLRRTPRDPTRGGVRRPHHRAHRLVRRGLFRCPGRPVWPGRCGPLPLGGCCLRDGGRFGCGAGAAAPPDPGWSAGSSGNAPTR